MTQTQWIPWNGGDRPLEMNVEVEVKFRLRGTEQQTAGWFDWAHAKPGEYSGYDIVAYRPVKG